MREPASRPILPVHQFACQASRSGLQRVCEQGGTRTGTRHRFELWFWIIQAPTALASKLGLRWRSTRQKTRKRAAWSRSWKTSFRRISPPANSVIIMMSGASPDSVERPDSTAHFANASIAFVRREESRPSSALICTTTSDILPRSPLTTAICHWLSVRCRHLTCPLRAMPSPHKQSASHLVPRSAASQQSRTLTPRHEDSTRRGIARIPAPGRQAWERFASTDRYAGGRWRRRPGWSPGPRCGPDRALRPACPPVAAPSHRPRPGHTRRKSPPRR
jgi:hypothetical protein